MMWDDLKALVDNWHEAAEKIPGYRHTLENGEGINLMLTVRRTQRGELELQVMAVKDHNSTISPGELLQPEDLKTINDPSIPIATLTVQNQA